MRIGITKLGVTFLLLAPAAMADATQGTVPMEHRDATTQQWARQPNPNAAWQRQPSVTPRLQDATPQLRDATPRLGDATPQLGTVPQTRQP
jgi:hypothetical protein